MPNVKELINFLSEINETNLGIEVSNTEAELELKNISKDTTANKGDLAWVSEKGLSRQPERVKNFLGTALICPEGSAPYPAVGKEQVLVECRHPKLAFIRSVTQFFSELTSTHWPEQGKNPVHPGTKIGKDFMLATGVVIGSNVTIGDNVTIGPNSAIANCFIGNSVVIGANCSIGMPGFGYEKDETGSYWRFPHIGRVILEEGVEIGSNTCIDRGGLGDTILFRGTKIDNLVHVAHNVKVGRDSIIIANAMIGGSVKLGDGTWVAPSASLRNQIEVGNRTIIGLGAVVLESIESDKVVIGNPAKFLSRQK